MTFLTAKQVLDAGLVYSIAGPGGALTAEKQDEKYVGGFWVFGVMKAEADCDSLYSILTWIEEYGAKCLHVETTQ